MADPREPTTGTRTQPLPDEAAVIARAADGDRLEFKATKGMLASLHEGDRVQVVIQKAPGTPERSPTSGTERLRPEQPK